MQLCPGCFSAPYNPSVCGNCKFDARLPAPSQRLQMGIRLQQQFIVGRILGAPGGFGVTYLAYDEVLQTRVAIKEFFPSDLAQRLQDRISVFPLDPNRAADFEQGLDGFLREARLLAQLNHPNIVRIRTFFKANGTAYMVMDYYEGMNGEEYFRRKGILSEAEARQLFNPILSGLSEVHHAGILHRDIKPENLYITQKGRPLLLDFGTARQELNKKSRHFTVVLTRGFAPPEQYSEKGKQGVWSDIYAIGATLYYLTTGKIPADALDRSHEDKLIPPHQLNPSLSATFSDVVYQCLALRPEKRPNSIQNLETLLQKTGSSATPQQAAQSVRPQAPPSASAKRAMSCPKCKVKNQIPTAAVLEQLRCGKCSTFLLPKTHILAHCQRCGAKNKIPHNISNAWCGKCNSQIG
jgi:serine/threonine protein kinase